MLLWIRDFLDDAMSAADDARFLRRATAAKRLVERLADADRARRSVA
jgi:hypothetical protein